MIQDKWYGGGLRFTCTQCGNCCSGAPGDVWVNETQRRAIAAFLELDYDDFMARYVRKQGSRYSLQERDAQNDWACVFLKEEDGRRLCSIYPVRPTQCRTWPFWNHNLRSPAAWEAAGTICPGLNQGKHYDFVQIEVERARKF